MKMIPTIRRGRVALGAAVLGALALLTAACGVGGGTANEPGVEAAATPQLTVLTSFYPLQFVAAEVAGPLATVTNLTPPAADPHDLELSLAAANAINTADLVLVLGGFQPAVDQAVAARNPARLIDAADYVNLLPALATADEVDDGHDHDDDHDDHAHDDDDYAHDDAADPHAGHAHTIGGYDPHFWLDPTRLALLAEPVADALSDADPAHADTFQANAAALVAALTELDQDFAAALAPFAGSKLVTSHTAFAYLAGRYGLDQVGIAGLDPEVEPSPARLREIGDIVRANQVTTIFYDTLASPRVVQTLANDLGVSAAVLHTVEGLSAAELAAGENYLTVMRANLAVLAAHLN